MNGGGDRRGKGKEKKRKWREKGEKVKVKKWMVNEVNLMNMMYAANGKNVKRSKVTLHKKTMGCWLALEYCCWLVLEYSGSRFLLYISSRFLLYIKGSTYARTLLYGFLILIIRIHFAFTFTLSTDSPNSPFTTFTFSLSLFHFCQMWLLTFCTFCSFWIFTHAFSRCPLWVLVPGDGIAWNFPLPVPIFLRRDVAIPASRRNNSRIAT